MTTPATLTEALVAFQTTLPRVTKDALNPHFKSKYADLADITYAVIPALATVGIATTATPTLVDGAFVLRTTLTHTSGDTVTATWPLPDPSATSPQQLGSALTYARRYTLAALTGIAPDDDDDGNAAEPTRARPAILETDRIDRAETALTTASTITELASVWAKVEQSGLANNPRLNNARDRMTELLAEQEGDDA